MSEYVKEYTFENPPKEILYIDGEPLKLSNDFYFFHNKNKFRKDLNSLQFLFRDYVKTPLVAAGIRDTYLKEKYSENNLIVLFTTMETHKRANEIIEPHLDKASGSEEYYLETTSEYMLLIAKDMEGLRLGIKLMEEIFKLTFEDYVNQQKFDDYIKIRQFKIRN